ncbi:MAG: hypothetical protein ACXV44_05385 [Halobacteriota archaeon]
MNAKTLRALYRRFLPDDTAALLFYATFVLCIALWNVNIFINDEVTLAAQLLNLAHGALSIEAMPARLYEGLSFGSSAPILGFSFQGHTYGFYTHAIPVFAAPFYALIYLVSISVGIRLFFAWLWSFSILMVCWLFGRRYGKAQMGRNVGILLASALFVINAYLGTQMSPLIFADWGALMAIQLFNISAMAVTVLLSLRIFTRYFADNRIAAFGGVYLLIATPLTFWALSAKDHPASVLLMVGGMWCLYAYLLDNTKYLRYLSYVLVGLSFWVRAFDALSLFIAIFVTDMAFSRERRLKQTATAFGTVVLAMIPYFINNYLLFQNPLLSPVYLSAHQEIGAQTTGPSTNGGSMVVATLERLPSLFLNTWNPQTFPSWPQNLYNVLFYTNMPVTLSVFQLCPLLIIPLFASLPYLIRKLKRIRSKSVSVSLDAHHAIAVAFFVYIIAHLAFYAPFQEQGFGLDMRYFLPLYVPLLFFTLASIQKVVAYSENIEKAFVGAWLVFSASALGYAAITSLLGGVFAQWSFGVNRALGGITALAMSVFIPYFVGYRRGEAKLALLVGVATFVSAYWLVVACCLWPKTPLGVPRPGMMLALMEFIHQALVASSYVVT